MRIQKILIARRVVLNHVINMKECNFFRLYFLLVLAVFICACRGNTINTMESIKFDKLLKIDQSVYPLGHINSIAICEDSSIVLCSDKQVSKYNSKGNYEGKVGNLGRAVGEYNMPLFVRSWNNQIYVWSAMTLKFLIYGMDGQLIGECPYESAISDFLPYDRKIFIYTSGLRDTNIVDVYDIDAKAVTCSLTTSSETHKASRMLSVSPMAVLDGKLYYMSRDKLTIYQYDLNSQKSTTIVGDLESDSFFVPDIKNVKDLYSDKKKALTYLDKASYVVSIIPISESRFRVLSSEGEYYIKDDKRCKSRRFYSLYDINDGIVTNVSRFSAEEFPNPALICNFKNNNYFLKEVCDLGSTENQYVLCEFGNPLKNN